MAAPLIILGVSLVLAYMSQKGILTITIFDKYKIDVPYIALIVFLGLICGLRTYYNDTFVYIKNYNNAPTVQEYLDSNPELLNNPLFYLCVSYFRHHISETHYIFFLLVGFFTNFSFIRFIKKHSTNFVFSITIFFAIGLFTDTLAAMKQCLALAVATYAIDQLLKKRYLLYFIIVFIAMLFHGYAFFLFVLPLFTYKPWTITTYIVVACAIVLLLTFQTTLLGLVDASEESGAHVSAEELNDNIGINPLRLAVFAVPPALSFVFHEYLDKSYDKKTNIFMHMSILSFLVMSMGIYTAANLFGRCAMYFELGSIIILPWIIDELFDSRSSKMITWIAQAFYIAFFVYLTRSFIIEYRYTPFIDFIKIVSS